METGLCQDRIVIGGLRGVLAADWSITEHKKTKGGAVEL